MRAMQAINLEDIDRPDVVALDKEGQVVLIAEVKGFPFKFQDTKNQEYAILRLIDYLKAAKTLIPFTMLVDTQNILIFRWNGENLSEPILCLNTAEAWISNFCYHWKSENPPASKEIGEIGLLQRLEGGITQP
jgi:hypothetical protein